MNKKVNKVVAYAVLLIKGKFVSKVSELKESALDITIEWVNKNISKSVEYKECLIL